MAIWHMCVCARAAVPKAVATLMTDVSDSRVKTRFLSRSQVVKTQVSSPRLVSSQDKTKTKTKSRQSPIQEVSKSQQHKVKLKDVGKQTIILAKAKARGKAKRWPMTMSRQNAVIDIVAKRHGHVCN